jgi:DNA-binding GntR family transcriptional regulator
MQSMGQAKPSLDKPSLLAEGARARPDANPDLADIVRRAEVHYTTVGEMVHGILRQAILNGVLAPGEHLRQDALAESIGVSRMPVRSALLQLESEGLVAFHPHRGAVVTALSVEQVREIYEIRLMLEGHALRRGIESITPERLERLEHLAGELDGADSGEGFARLSFHFYRELYDAQTNPLLVGLIERLHSDVGRYWLRRRVLDQHEAGHAELLRYARTGDADGAVRWLRDHLGRVAEELVALVAQGSSR